MTINWPELKFPPINLWSYPRMKNFIRINDIIVPLDDVRYISRSGTKITVALADNFRSELSFEDEIEAINFFNSIEKQLITERDSYHDDDWEF